MMRPSATSAPKTPKIAGKLSVITSPTASVVEAMPAVIARRISAIRFYFLANHNPAKIAVEKTPKQTPAPTDAKAN